MSTTMLRLWVVVVMVVLSAYLHYSSSIDRRESNKSNAAAFAGETKQWRRRRRQRPLTNRIGNNDDDAGRLFSSSALTFVCLLMTSTLYGHSSYDYARFLVCFLLTAAATTINTWAPFCIKSIWYHSYYYCVIYIYSTLLFSFLLCCGGSWRWFSSPFLFSFYLFFFLLF